MLLGTVGAPCDPAEVRVTERDVERVPPGNLRVPRRDFGVLWSAAEQGSDFASVGTAITCRWLARATVDLPRGRQRPAFAPVTRTRRLAYEELIEAEYLAAERLAGDEPEWLAARPGYLDGVRNTLRWAWRGEGPAPSAN